MRWEKWRKRKTWVFNSNSVCWLTSQSLNNPDRHKFNMNVSFLVIELTRNFISQVVHFQGYYSVQPTSEQCISFVKVSILRWGKIWRWKPSDLELATLLLMILSSFNWFMLIDRKILENSFLTLDGHYFRELTSFTYKWPLTPSSKWCQFLSNFEEAKFFLLE